MMVIVEDGDEATTLLIGDRKKERLSEEVNLNRSLKNRQTKTVESGMKLFQAQEIPQMRS